MATVREITTMCRAGQVQEAYELAKADMEIAPTDPWTQREVGWALNYLMKDDTDRADFQGLLSHIDEILELDQLSIPQDIILFDNVLFKIAGFVKAHINPTGIGSPAKLSTLFSKLKGYTFGPSNGYSFLLSSVIKCDSWQEMLDFIDWWNLSNLTQEDYTPYKLENGRIVMSVAERAFIAKSKALIRLNDLGRIEEFLPQMDELMEKHPEMAYPGYFYGKLLVSLGSTTDDALRVILPFARKKASEFWVWQLLSDVFVNDQDKQLACLLRAVHCRTQEDFLGKVRIKLAQLYEIRGDYNRARYHVDIATRTYASNGWPLPYELDILIHKQWIATSSSEKSEPFEYMRFTDEILCEGTEEAVAIVTNFDPKSHKATLIYGKEKRMVQRLRFKIGPGVVLKINYITETDGNQRILSANQTPFPTNLDFAKVVEGSIKKRDEWAFAFFHYGDEKAFVAPNTVNKYNVKDGEFIKALVVYDYDRKKEKWNWICLSVKR